MCLLQLDFEDDDESEDEEGSNSDTSDSEEFVDALEKLTLA